MRNTEINYTINTIFFQYYTRWCVTEREWGTQSNVQHQIFFFSSIDSGQTSLTMNEGGRGWGNVSSNDTELVQAENMTPWRQKKAWDNVFLLTYPRVASLSSSAQAE